MELLAKFAEELDETNAKHNNSTEMTMQTYVLLMIGEEWYN
jgi:hypothetical protein